MDRLAGDWPCSVVVAALCVAAGLVCVPGCASPEQKAAQHQQRYEAAQSLFEQTTKVFHLPSADADGAERERLLAQAAAGYDELLRKYPDQSHWSAQALRSLGNVRAEQGRLDEAVGLYARVGARYPREDWEVLQAWKSAGDLLWEAGRAAEARRFYEKIVERFDSEPAPAVVQLIVRGSKSRLAGR
jgi:tetratricopeptide (TPR) repeat protein